MNQVFLDGITSGFTYGLVALSFGLIYTSTRFFHFAHAVVFTWGAYFGYVCHTLLKLPFWIAIPLATGMAAVLGLIFEAAIFRPMRKRGASSVVLLLASLGLYIVLQNTVSLIFGDATQIPREGNVVVGYVLFGAHITLIQIWTVVASGMSFGLVAMLMKFTLLGQEFRAVASDVDLARVRGINVDHVTLATFALGSALVGLAGLLVSLDVDMTPTMGLNPLMAGVVALIVGGIGSTPGSLMGGLLLGLAQNLGGWKVGSQWQDVIAFLTLIFFLLFRPHGFFGRPFLRPAS